MYGAIDAGGDWAISFAAGEGIKSYAIVSGRCWLSVDTIAEPVLLEAGDCVLLPLGSACSLSAHPATPAIDFETIVTAPLQGGTFTYNGGGDCLGFGGYFSVGREYDDILLNMLPPVVHIHKETDRAELRSSLERMMKELRDPKPGGALVIQHVASMMLVQALRLHLAEGVGNGPGWLFALADRDMNAAFNLMHGAPGYRWTLAELAERVGMSRSSFALKFKATVGTSPMEYLSRWRMMLAGDRLTNSGDPVSAIADSLGYESESAFSAAFKRIMNYSPREYARRSALLHH